MSTKKIRIALADGGDLRVGVGEVDRDELSAEAEAG